MLERQPGRSEGGEAVEAVPTKSTPHQHAAVTSLVDAPLR
jgi:hypothetical protein